MPRLKVSLPEFRSVPLSHLFSPRKVPSLNEFGEELHVGPLGAYAYQLPSCDSRGTAAFHSGELTCPTRYGPMTWRNRWCDLYPEATTLVNLSRAG